MGWQETKVKDEKLKFISDWLKREFTFKHLCERYGISRKTGYKLIGRYEQEGELALTERSKVRHRHPNETAPAQVQLLLEMKYRYPTWGPLKLKKHLSELEPAIGWPSASTIGELLKRYGLVKPRRRRKRVPGYGHVLRESQSANEIWSADFKGQFRLGNQRYCYPLTVSDHHSRYLLLCEGLDSPTLKATRRCFEALFADYGLPEKIRTDNGQPFAGVGIGGLTALSVWWLKLGILPERIAPGCPEQNGRHERMHKTLKEATALVPQQTFVEQQTCFERFQQEYNEERPHQALAFKRPTQLYEKSARELPSSLPEVTYDEHFDIRNVRSNGEIKYAGKHYYVSELLCGEPVGLEKIDDERALLYFSRLKLGLIDARLDKITRP